MNPTGEFPILKTDAITEEECRKVRLYFRENVKRARSYQGLVDHSKRECEYVALAVRDAPGFQSFAARELRSASDVLIEFDDSQPILVYRYPVGVGFVPHHDLVTAVELERAKFNEQPVIHGDFTVVLSLSAPSEYDGGELFFPDHDIVFKPPMGSIVAFPATEEWVHGVRPITRGARYVAVGRPVRVRD